MTGLSLIVPALGLGLAYAATPGVVNTECVRRGMVRGFRPAFSIQLGALLGDAVWAAFALAGVAALARRESLGMVLGLVGSLFLCRLGFGALREAWSGPRARGTAASTGGDLGTGIIFGLANPAGLAFWAGVGGGVLAARKTDPGFDVYAGFLAAFSIGVLCWAFGFSALVAWGRRFARPRLFRAIDALCGAVLSFFGVRLLWTTVRRVRR